MAPRKRELLDVLRRQQQSPEAEERPAPKPAAPRAAHFRFRFGPSQRRAWLRVGFALLWTVLVVWLLCLLFAGGADPVSTPDAGPALPPRKEPAVEAPAVGAQPPKAEAPAFGVLAITYQGDSQRQTAQRVGGLLQQELQLPDVRLHRSEERGKVWYELYVGRAADSAALTPLLQKVRGLSLPGESGKPFASAYVRQLPKSQS